MPYRKNPKREQTLLDHYIVGHTIKVTSVLTGIPSSTVGYYFRKFKSNPEHVMMRIFAQSSTEKSEPSEEKIIKIIYLHNNLLSLNSIVSSLFSEGKYSDARNFLESMKILDEYNKE